MMEAIAAEKAKHEKSEGRPSDPPYLVLLLNMTGCADGFSFCRVLHFPAFRLSAVLPASCICSRHNSYPVRSLHLTFVTEKWLQPNIWHPLALIYQATPPPGQDKSN
ncbi:MAG: hypothetical protein RQ826_07950 [Xanthomonadales bacterium]|nr:hypothetical protein [Xanthomonadales bacterium]